MPESTFTAPILKAPHNEIVHGFNGICHGTVMRMLNHGKADTFTVHLIDTSAQTKVVAGPFVSRGKAQARIVKFLNNSRAYYAAANGAA